MKFWLAPLLWIPGNRCNSAVSGFLFLKQDSTRLNPISEGLSHNYLFIRCRQCKFAGFILLCSGQVSTFPANSGVALQKEFHAEGMRT